MTTKLNNGNHRPDDARRSFARSLETLGLDHVDLFLIHWPRPRYKHRTLDGYVAAWQALEELARDGRARSIGVSNFEVEHLERLAAETDLAPAVNQIELHPYFQNREVAAWGDQHGVVTEAWAPIARGAVLGDPVVAEVAAAHDRTPAQVVLRWHLQHGFVVFPKSSSPARLRRELRRLRLRRLSAEEMARIDGLERGEAGRTGMHPNAFGRSAGEREEHDVGAERRGERPVPAGLVPRTVDRAGSTPCARAKASGRPGSGGRHQQTGGPPPCGQTAASTRPVTTRSRRPTTSASSSTRPSGRQSKTRCGASGAASATAASQPSSPIAPAATKTPAASRPGVGRRSNGMRSTWAKPSSSLGGSRSRSARICEVGARSPGSAPGGARSSSGPGSAPSGRAGARRG